jgi:hypothetical protein
VGSYYEVFPDHLVSIPIFANLSCTPLISFREITRVCSRSTDRSSSTRLWESEIT